MYSKAGFHIVRVTDLPWENRIRFGGKCRNRAKTYINDSELGLAMRLVDFPVGAIEPRHVHPGTHVATVLKGRAIVDGVTLRPLDAVLGPGNEPHGPLEYPDGCNLLSAFQGSNAHSEAYELSKEKKYRLVQHEQVPWAADGAEGKQTKTLVDHGAGRLLVRAVRYPGGASIARHTHAHTQAALILEGEAVVEDETLGIWDMLYQPGGVEHGPVTFPNGALLLALTMRIGNYSLP